MVIFPNCKINLGLNVIGKREDGYHNIETVFLPLPVYDALEIIETKNETTFSTTGFATGNNEKNLCLKAYFLLKKDFRKLPEIQCHLHKAIPVGAGLGGGSSDATHTLLLLNKKLGLNISQEQLFGYALQLGSDCPFFLLNKSSMASGRGEILKPVSLPLSKYKILLINPGISINTKDIFEKITPQLPARSISEIITQPVSTWKNLLQNDFEKVVFPQYPEVADLKEKMYENGALYASMSGTGSSVFGIFDPLAKEPIMPKELFKKWKTLD
jgi:4-diphosphocytidyl-2-C-methyl-D-erythritol kinase